MISNKIAAEFIYGVPIGSAICRECQDRKSEEGRKRGKQAALQRAREPGIREYRSCGELVRSHVLMAWMVETLGSDAFDNMVDSLVPLPDVGDEVPDPDSIIEAEGLDGSLYPMSMVDGVDLNEFLRSNQHGWYSAPPLSEVRYRTFAAVLVACHGALEAYLKALGVAVTKKSLPVALHAYLREQGRDGMMDVELYQRLLDFDATRHVIVHNAGIVDGKYVRQVVNPPFVEGELRHLDWSVVYQFAQDVLVLGDILLGREDLG